MFEFYLSSCELGFRYSSLAVFQIQLSHQQAAVPLTRDYITGSERGLVRSKWEPASPERMTPAKLDEEPEAGRQVAIVYPFHWRCKKGPLQNPKGASNKLRRQDNCCFGTCFLNLFHASASSSRSGAFLLARQRGMPRATR